MSNPRFDPNMPHGTIHPSYQGAQIQQGDHFFAGNGDFLFTAQSAGSKAGTVAQAAAPATPARMKLAPLKKAETPAPAPDPDETDDIDTPEPADPDAIDFTLWASGEKNYPWFKVKRAASEMFPDIDTKNKDALLDGLISLGAVNEDSVKR